MSNSPKVLALFPAHVHPWTRQDIPCDNLPDLSQSTSVVAVSETKTVRHHARVSAVMTRRHSGLPSAVALVVISLFQVNLVPQRVVTLDDRITSRYQKHIAQSNASQSAEFFTKTI